MVAERDGNIIYPTCMGREEGEGPATFWRKLKMQERGNPFWERAGDFSFEKKKCWKGSSMMRGTMAIGCFYNLNRSMIFAYNFTGVLMYNPLLITWNYCALKFKNQISSQLESLTSFDTLCIVWNYCAIEVIDLKLLCIEIWEAISIWWNRYTSFWSFVLTLCVFME